ncbi:hypothetical protein MVEN_01713800 [Mycena venus]|uniref:Uncharacterized protein n=1 Tax=Mycena venus TaxID=2733690 RepID=A0A8H7CNF9_9AGAR|nr:hypothetical protein MVEN_01713800 [Mycena venus]
MPLLFSIASTPGFEALGLSYVLLRFMNKYIREADYDRFKLFSLSYRLGPSAAFGVLVFDRRLHSAYQQAWIKSRLDSRYHSRRFDLPLSTWPTRSVILRTPKEVKKLMVAGIGSTSKRATGYIRVPFHSSFRYRSTSPPLTHAFNNTLFMCLHLPPCVAQGHLLQDTFRQSHREHSRQIKPVATTVAARDICFKIPEPHIQVTIEKSNDDEENKSQIEICKAHKDDEDDEDELPPLT